MVLPVPLKPLVQFSGWDFLQDPMLVEVVVEVPCLVVAEVPLVLLDLVKKLPLSFVIMSPHKSICCLPQVRLHTNSKEKGSLCSHCIALLISLTVHLEAL